MLEYDCVVIYKRIRQCKEIRLHKDKWRNENDK
jgi:hypothetical protein